MRSDVGDEVSIDPVVHERMLDNGAVFFQIELPAFATFVPDREGMRASGVPLTVVVGAENRDSWFGAAAPGWSWGPGRIVWSCPGATRASGATWSSSSSWCVTLPAEMVQSIPLRHPEE